MRTDRNGAPNVFNVERNEDGSWLNASNGNPGNQWNPENAFVFVPRNLAHFSPGTGPGEFAVRQR